MIALKPAGSSDPHGDKCRDPQPKVEITDLRKSFGDQEILKGISFSACEGDVISILGSSGSGKSTLLRCVNFLEVADSGDITVCGERVRTKRTRAGQTIVDDAPALARLRSRVAMVFQNFHLWSHRTILENVVEAPIHVQKRPRAECVEEAEALLHKVGIYEKRHHYPVHLSGGQQQRAAIARALAMRPDVLLFDEPTSALDPELVGEVLRVMRMLADEGRTMLVVTHEMAFARDVSTKVIFLHQGLIEAEGSPEELFSNSRSERFRQFIKRTA
jgi:octopine/nopaline transport system ATP-binding protein